MDDDYKLASPPAWPEIVRKIRARTPARIFVERGLAYSTQMALELRGAHASAMDAVWTEFDLQKDFPPEFGFCCARTLAALSAKVQRA